MSFKEWTFFVAVKDTDNSVERIRYTPNVYLNLALSLKRPYNHRCIFVRAPEEVRIGNTQSSCVSRLPIPSL